MPTTPTPRDQHASPPGGEHAARGSRLGDHLSWLRRRGWPVWAVLVFLSQLALWAMMPDRERPALPEGVQAALLDTPGVLNREGREQLLIGYRHWRPERVPESGLLTPVILLHGSPGMSGDFTRLAPLLALQGREVFAPDLPGFGASEHPAQGHYGADSHAKVVLAFADRNGLDRFHIIGWSSGGGVALELEALLRDTPDRLASLTMMASIGLQETEGSGSHTFEHVKYDVGTAVLVWARHLVPHFGLFGRTPVWEDQGMTGAFLYNFAETDQRRLGPIMRSLRTPALVLHGRKDFLIADWAAQRHFEVTPTARLVIVDGGHFLPYIRPEDTAGHLNAFMSRHDTPGVEPLRTRADLMPVEAPFGGVGERALRWMGSFGWPVLLALVFFGALVSERWTLVLLAIPVIRVEVDYFLLGLALVLAAVVTIAVRFAHARLRPGSPRAPDDRMIEDWRRRLERAPLWSIYNGWLRADLRREVAPAAGVIGIRPDAVLLLLIAVVLRVCVLMVGVILIEGLIAQPPVYPLGALSIVLALGAGLLAYWLVDNALSWSGRRTILARLARLRHHEYWPTFALYLPLLPTLVPLARRAGHPLAFTASNPGIEAGGGMVGESKSGIQRHLRHEGPEVLPMRLIPARGEAGRARPASERAAEVEGLLEAPPAGAPRLSLPVILKPDAGCRGSGVTLARTAEDIRRFFRRVDRDAVVQPYHPGPNEAGLLWARRPGSEEGFIFSVTRKTFPVVEGNGRSTLERLIYAHRRLRRQAPVLLASVRAQRSRVPAPGERVRVGDTGNHCRGTMFTDGSDLITPELTRVMDAIARSYRDDAGNPLDIGRFDVRYTSDDDLRAGRGFGIIELNGTTGESTNLYDPSRSVVWAVGVMRAHWALLYALGAERMRQGVRPMRARDLLRAWWRERRSFS